jgi:uncharacterized metal-binding protein
MNIAITIFAWIGLTVTALLAACTLFIWAQWVWEQLLEAGTRSLGLFYATSFYCGVALGTKEEQDEAAAKLLWMRYRRIARHRPKLAEHFEGIILRNRKPAEEPTP